MRIQLSILTVVALSQVAATDCGKVLRDPGFDLWCGDELCTWKVVRGEAKRVPTWHDEDLGVELLGPDAAIAQLAPVTSGDGTCIRFDLVADVDEDAEAQLGIDVFGDGTIDHSERIPTSRWKPLSYKLRLRAPYNGVRFELAKRGSGRAVFAQIAATIDSGCEGHTEISGAPAPLGAWCNLDVECGSGRCRVVPDAGSWLGVAKVCVECEAGTCGGTDVCGRGDPVSPVLEVPQRCVPAGSRELGDQCIGDPECASGICTGGVCSACNAPCGTELCERAYALGPYVCSPGQHLRASGEPCATDADCASSRCNGAVRMQCHDGRACDSPADCPVEDDLAPGACESVGIQGGRCQ